MNNLLPPSSNSGESLPVAATATGAIPHSDARWAPAEPPPEERSNQGAKLRRYWAAIKRFRWLVIALAVLGTAAGVAASRFIEPMYEAQGKVWISDASPRGGGGNPTQAPELLPTGSWVELFKSFAVVDRVVNKKRLFISYKSHGDSAVLASLNSTPKMVPGLYTLDVDAGRSTFTLVEDKLGVVDQGTVGDSIGRRVGFLWAPPAEVLQGHSQITFNIAQPRSVAVGLVNSLEVIMGDNSNFLRLSLTGQDKWRTADLLNTWMEEFVATAADLRRRNMSDVAGILESQRESAQGALRTAENDLQAFRSSTITEPGEGAVGTSSAIAGGGASDALATAFFKNQSDYEAIQRDRQALEQIAANARNGTVSPDEVLSIPSVASAPGLSGAIKDLMDREAELAKLKQSYTDEYKPVQTLKATINSIRTQTIPNLAQNSANILRSQENRLASRLRRDSVQLRNVPQRSIEEARLRRNLSVAENLFTTLENRYETTRLGAVSTVPDVNILDPALPAAAPARNMKLILMVGGFGASLALGIAIALLLDMVDHRFRYPEQIADELNLEVIGAIPAVPSPGDALKDPEAMLHSVEAFRGLRMRVHYAFDKPPAVFTISSPGAGDGKSMISSNLALSFAEAGFRTLVIDGDIRRGKLHSVFEIDRRPGLIDYLAGEAELHSIIRQAPSHPKLSVIPSGTRRHRGPELLTSALVPTMFNILRPRYDVIIVDSAPLGAGIDAYAFGVATGNMMIVMRPGVTDRRMAKAKVKLLQQFPVRILGAVVNHVPAAGLYQEYSYLYGYSPDSDADVANDPGTIPMLRADAAKK